MRIVLVSQSQVAIVERFGRYHRTLTPGINIIWPILDRVRYVANTNQGSKDQRRSAYRIDLREQILDIEKQDVITKDNVGMDVDTLVFYRILDPVKVVYGISSPIEAIRHLSKTAIRNVFGEMDLDTTLSARESINARLRTVLDEATDKWGIQVIRVEIQDITPPVSLKETMQKQMIAERERRARVTSAEAEKQAMILQAQGQKQDEILRAEGESEAMLLRAEAQKKTKIVQAEGEAQAIHLVQKATAAGLDAIRETLGKTSGLRGLLTLETLKAQAEVAKHLSSGQSTKILMPTEMAGLFGVAAGIKEMLGSDGHLENESTQFARSKPNGSVFRDLSTLSERIDTEDQEG